MAAKGPPRWLWNHEDIDCYECRKPLLAGPVGGKEGCAHVLWLGGAGEHSRCVCGSCVYKLSQYKKHRRKTPRRKEQHEQLAIY